jgi:3-phenylpropionate/trans-cinnamate dioxygenase ferredoxin component
VSENVTSIALGALPEVGEGEMVSLRPTHGIPVAIARVEGEFLAFDEMCTHRTCSLVRGDLEGRVVACPCHGAEFDVGTGAVVLGPAERPLRTYRVTVEDGTATLEL